MDAKSIVRSALIGALYAVTTFATVTVLPLNVGPIQLRLSEALCVLPCFLPAAVPGLFVGCVLANLLTGAAAYDVLFGSLATLLAAWMTRRLYLRGAKKWLLPLPAVLVNAVVVGGVIRWVYGFPASYPLCVLYIGASQIISCYGLGLPLMAALEKNRIRLKL